APSNVACARFLPRSTCSIRTGAMKYNCTPAASVPNTLNTRFINISSAYAVPIGNANPPNAPRASTCPPPRPPRTGENASIRNSTRITTGIASEKNIIGLRSRYRSSFCATAPATPENPGTSNLASTARGLGSAWTLAFGVAPTVSPRSSPEIRPQPHAQQRGRRRRASGELEHRARRGQPGARRRLPERMNREPWRQPLGQWQPRRHRAHIHPRPRPVPRDRTNELEPDNHEEKQHHYDLARLPPRQPALDPGKDRL